MKNVIPLYPQFVIQKLIFRQLRSNLSEYEYILFSDRYVNGKLLSFREFIMETRKFTDIDLATASVIQLTKDETALYINGLKT